ncbi:venom serine carboxypeptidase-like [Plodia interpunctella]|uniref:venom serine carboxypeptidase-like n=1 Tax=Plodia interpunctella TaxID=58824 RepID=UPI002368A955|nr:venom serine carboxypeptidase-like [Plodia interpunctella]
MKVVATLIFVLICSILQTKCDDCNESQSEAMRNGILLLTPLIEKGCTVLAKSLAAVEPQHFSGLESYSGFITVKEKYFSNLFFWFFPKQNRTENSPWIIWLQGGPGFSSMVGLFDIMGPLEMQDNQVKLRNVTWASNYSLLFIDNPVGAGFSFTADDRGYTTNEDAVGGQLYTFLQQFLDVFPEFRKAPLFVAGQSYAGKYVPALAIQIHRHRNDQKPVRLGGCIMGNALIDPRNMMAYSSLCGELGLVTEYHLEELEKLEQSVVQLIDEQRMIDASNKFNETIEYIKEISGVNIYNFLKDPSFGAPQFEHFIQRADVRSWIHVGDTRFVLNNQLVYQKMLPDIMNSTRPFVEELLEFYPILVYSGQLDLIIPYSLTKRSHDMFRWSGSKEFRMARRRLLKRSGRVEAYKKSGGNLEEVLIRGGGHMVAVENPSVTKFVVDQFINSTLHNVKDLQGTELI